MDDRHRTRGTDRTTLLICKECKKNLRKELHKYGCESQHMYAGTYKHLMTGGSLDLGAYSGHQVWKLYEYLPIPKEYV